MRKGMPFMQLAILSSEAVLNQADTPNRASTRAGDDKNPLDKRKGARVAPLQHLLTPGWQELCVKVGGIGCRSCTGRRAGPRYTTCAYGGIVGEVL